MFFNYQPWRYPPIEKVYLEKKIIRSLPAQNIRKNLKKISCYSHTQVEEIENADDILFQYRSNDNRLHRDHLLVHHKKSNFFEKCPGSDGVLCCHYFIIDNGMNCPYDCSYCFLQSYMGHSLTTLFANSDDLFNNLQKQMDSNRLVHWRIGTGEYTDSLAYDYLSEFSFALINFFAQQKNATLELKTKSDNIGNLLQVREPKNTVVAWSLNPQNIIEQWEKGTAPLHNRLLAARALQEHGYQLAFHFDPLIYHDNWQKNYSEVLEELFSFVSPKAIRWISLGTFRYSTALKENLRLREAQETLTSAEMLAGSDGKWRYFFPMRTQMYQFMQKQIARHNKEIFVYLCMESKDAWQRTHGWQPRGEASLDKMFEYRRKQLLFQK